MMTGFRVINFIGIFGLTVNVAASFTKQLTNEL